MSKKLDLHMHTVYSDGTCTPAELVTAACEQGVQAMAITDHDNVESLRHAQEAARETTLELIPGIEINTVWQEREVHVLGYYIDPAHDLLTEVMDQHRQWRVVQMQDMAVKMRKHNRLDITFEDIASRGSAEGVLGRPHVAKTLVDKGVVSTISDAFNRYLRPSCPTYVRRQTVPPHDAVEAIYESGGIPVIAHPGDMEGIEGLATELIDYGLRGLEAYHRSHSPALIEFHCSLAEKLDLIVTGGTDFHGAPEAYPRALERLHMPIHIYDVLQDERRGRQLSLFKAS
ncbi:MAG: PHP domain-containing protein [Candidatus Melainabacteria bacterium]